MMVRRGGGIVGRSLEAIADEARTLRGILRHRLVAPPTLEREVVEKFHQLYFYTPDRTWRNTYWLGVPTQKCPLDLWVYQEMLHELRPDLIVETGTAHGGSALYLSSICDLLGTGTVVTIDVAPNPNRPSHPRLTYLTGSSTAPEIVAQVREMARGPSMILVILDSDHRKHHVLAELRAYADLVTPGSYVVVEDSNNNGHPVERDSGPGPMEALEEFLAERRDFAIDPGREKFYLTFNPRGFLRRAR